MSRRTWLTSQLPFFGAAWCLFLQLSSCHSSPPETSNPPRYTIASEDTQTGDTSIGMGPTDVVDTSLTDAPSDTLGESNGVSDTPNDHGADAVSADGDDEAAGDDVTMGDDLTDDTNGDPELGLESDANDVADPSDVDLDVSDVADLLDAGPDSTSTYSIGGTVEGMTLGTSIALECNGEELPVPGNGTFVFEQRLAPDETYDVDILGDHPTDHTCIVVNGDGLIVDDDIVNIEVRCFTLVTPLLRTHGVAWNDFTANNGAPLIDSVDEPCTGEPSPLGPDACRNAGELRVVIVPGVSDCAGLTAEDNLGAFDWECDDSEVEVRFYTASFQSDLSLLIDFDAVSWRPNYVTVSDESGPIFANPEHIWWSNTVAVAPTGDGETLSLTEEGTIFLVNESSNVGYEFSDSQIALIVNPAIELGTLSDASINPLVQVSGVNFVWVEGAFDNQNAQVAISFELTRFSTLNNVTVGSPARTVDSAAAHVMMSGSNNRMSSVVSEDSHGNGIVLRDLTYSRVFDLEATGAQRFGVVIDTVQNSLITSVTSESNTEPGFVFDGSGAGTTVREAQALLNDDDGFEFNSSSFAYTLTNVSAVENDGDGFMIYGDGNLITHARSISNRDLGVTVDGDGNVLVSIVAANNDGDGIKVNGNACSLVDLTVTNNNSDGFEIWGHDNIFMNVTSGNNRDGFNLNKYRNLVVNAVFLNNREVGFQIADSVHHITVWDLVSAHNYEVGIEIVNANDNSFNGVLRVGSNGTGPSDDCWVTGSNPGIEHGTCVVGSAELTRGVNLSGMLVGRVEVNDVINTSDYGGQRNFAEISDWIGYEHQYRAWGFDATEFLSLAAAINCEDGDSCRIYDWAVTTDVSSVLWAQLPIPEESSYVVHRHNWDLDASECAEFERTWAGGVCITDFLHNAYELEGTGNGNGLCESDETCLVSQNIGSYQGHSTTYSSLGVGDFGTVTDVTLLSPDLNGY